MNKTNTNDQTIINDLADAMRRETTEAEKAYLAGEAAPSGKPKFFDWHAAIDNLKLTGDDSWFKSEQAAQLRKVLHRVADMTRKVGGKTVAIGKRLLAFIFEQIQRYPMTLSAIVVLAALNFFALTVPLIGPALSMIIHSVGTLIVGFVFAGESVLNVFAGFQRVRYQRYF